MLGTNPCDPNVLDKHIIEKQRKLILDKSKVNSQINKYLDAITISKDKGEEEVAKLIDKLEEMTGIALTDDERKSAMTGELDLLKETFKGLETTGLTVFFWDKDKNLPMIGDHMIYGFMKAASEAIARTVPTKKGTPLHSTSYTQSLINQHVRCETPFITLSHDIERDEDDKPKYLHRSLRGMTAQGPRVSLARSEVVPAGTSLEFTLKVMSGSPLLKVGGKGEVHENTTPIKMMFDYGELCGLGQWRNAGNGMFSYEMSEV